MKFNALVALMLFAVGCATTGTVATPQVIYTPNDDIVVKVQAMCWRVTAIDYDGERDNIDDLAYATLVRVACPARAGQ